MKYLFIAVVILFVSVISCSKKDALVIVEGSSNFIIHRWGVVYDSLYTGVAQNNHLVVYTGQEGDYFDFRQDSNLYIKEDTEMDTLHYSLINDGSVIIAGFARFGNGLADTTKITMPDSNHITLASPLEITPGGEFGRKVQLSK